MNLISNILISIIVVISLINGQNIQKPLNVLVLYESLCPDSVRFFRVQLAPAYDLIKKHINIQLVPFGKSNSINGGAEFQCQHGPYECEGNRIQSCVLNELQHNQDKQVEYGVCQMSGNADLNGKQCAENVGVSTDSMNYCITTDVGTTLQLQAETITHDYQPKFVPTVIYDGVFNQQLQDRSQNDFLGVVCGLLKQKGIQACNY